MKLLLTSAGIANKSIARALHRLAGKPFSKLKLAFIPTAANVEPGDKWWLLEDLDNLHKLGFNEFDIVDVSAIPKDLWLPRLKRANIIAVGGGNTLHLIRCMRKSGLNKELPALLKNRLYIGTSAGSIVTTPNQTMNKEFYHRDFAKSIRSDTLLNFVPFGILPHLNSPFFPKRTFAQISRISRKYKLPTYALDDQSAIVINGQKMTMVSEGTWKKFN